jgi:hypothetical protein
MYLHGCGHMAPGSICAEDVSAMCEVYKIRRRAFAKSGSHRSTLMNKVQQSID